MPVSRPYHLWSENEKVALRWRYYKHLEHAKINGLVEAKKAKIGVTIAVRDRENGRIFGQYTRGVGEVKFRNERNDYERSKRKHTRKRRNAAQEATGVEAH